MGTKPDTPFDMFTLIYFSSVSSTVLDAESYMSARVDPVAKGITTIGV
jgi:hypothetical protein